MDDNPHDLALLDAILSPHGYDIEKADDGVAAQEMLERDPTRFDVILADRNMPRMGGMPLLQFIKSHRDLKSLPVIVQTASDSRADLIEAMRGGALYYLTKPYDAEMLLTVVGTAAADRATYRRLQHSTRTAASALRVLQGAQFSIRTIDEARDVAQLLASVCLDPSNAVIGLTELLVNGVEHGNLGITYDEKSALNAEGTWEAEVLRRLALPENADKRVEVFFERREREICFTIRDDGPGFDWERYIEADPRRAFDTHGRGILIATRLSFDQLEYRGTGNEVVGFIKWRPS